MADAALATSPVPAEPAAFAGVTISLATGEGRWSLRARDVAELEQLLDRAVPRRIGQAEGGLACLGPDEWLLRLPTGTAPAQGEGMRLSVVDISHRAVPLVLEGPAAIDVLACGCPRDLARFAPGTARRTVYEGVEMILWRESESRFVVDVWRSFAPWMWTAFTKAASHL